MKFTNLFAPTTKEAPKDALLPSHKYLVRAGFVSQYGSGLYNYLPMGKMVLDNIRDIVKDEMDKTGACEIKMGVVIPADLWKQSGRYSVFGKELLRLNDRKNNNFVLGPTHEEVVVDMVRGKINSYKQLPMHLYQITTKFRDEARPRYGILRGREFIMKDGYSFHANEESMQKEFDLMEATYRKIFTRLGLDFRVVSADSGAIGGSGSKEFMVLANNGEDDIITCKNCEYAANIEASIRAKKTTQIEIPKANMAKFHTPNCNTITDVAKFFKVDEFYTVKAVIKKAIYVDKEEVVIFFLRGNDNLQETKAQNACGALELINANEEEIKKIGLIAGYCGPFGLNESINFFIDNELKDEKNLICGANEYEYHNIGMSMLNFNESRYRDLVEVSDSDRCSYCGGEFEVTKGIEVGHIFQLGQKYAKEMGATFLDENGKTKPFYMGCYGVGVSRLVAVMVEASHDEKGCIWNRQTTPFDLDIIISNIKNSDEFEFGNRIYQSLKEDGYSVLLDDRKERFGSKIRDFELIGFPYALIVGKGLKEGNVELVNRKTLEKTSFSVDKIENKIREILA
ncbi:MAG: proline--tRNA ligase [Sulfurospirillum sp.]|nr:proline--tRNA ligase [Sulfurospirillum sp.]MBL0703646.1 proline--tRNA ligase [Sulfurospirillum sp.]